MLQFLQKKNICGFVIFIKKKKFTIVESISHLLLNFLYRQNYKKKLLSFSVTIAKKKGLPLHRNRKKKRRS